VTGGRAVAGAERAHRLGADAYARSPGDAVARVREWESSPPASLRSVPAPVPESGPLADSRARLVAAAVEGADVDGRADLADELRRVLLVVDAALLLDEAVLLREHVQWLRATGPLHGIPLAEIDRALVALAGSMSGDLARAGSILQDAIA
jgi:hypothetical protein